MNRIYTSLRRYLNYLDYAGVHQGVHLPPQEPLSKDEISGKQIPGQLPTWDYLLGVLKKMKPGYERWVMTMCVAFGVRVSEALRIQPEHLLGSETVGTGSENDFIARINRIYKPFLYACVTESEQRIKVNSHILKVLGEDPDDPKSGDYNAACIDEGIAEFILTIIGNEEFVRHEDFVYNRLSTAIKSLPVDEEIKLQEYGYHDFRRVQITLMSLSWGLNTDVSQCHGHVGLNTTSKYYQWALALQRKSRIQTLKLIRKEA